MKRRFAALVSCSLFFVLGPAVAEQGACLMEGNFTLFGQKMEIKDCLQNDGVPQERFLESCKSIANATVAMGVPPAKTTYSSSCPTQSQGSCKGLFGTPMTAYYYKRDVQTLTGLKKSCEAQGGKWHGGAAAKK